MEKIIVKSFAKVNLSIDVKGLLPNGYHEVEMVMQQVGLYDSVEIEFEPWDEEGYKVELKTNLPYLPTDERNLAYKGANIFLEYLAYKIRYKVPNGVFHINIKKKVPVAAGLAGGSGNGAAVILGLNRLLDAKLPLKTLCEISKELGSDVPFSMMGQAKANWVLGKEINQDPLATSSALATGRGTDVMPIKGLDAYLILVKPAIGVSTKEVYQGIDNVQISKRPDNEALIEGLKEEDRDKIYESMANVLEEYTLDHYPIVKEIKEMLEKETEAEKVLMSGSGPTVFAIYKDKETAQKYCFEMRRKGYECYWARTTK